VLLVVAEAVVEQVLMEQVSVKVNQVNLVKHHLLVVHVYYQLMEQMVELVQLEVLLLKVAFATEDLEAAVAAEMVE
jgi:hypothetical protein